MGHLKNLEITKESEFVPEQEKTMNTQNYNHHLKAEVGDYIKSYDFRGVEDCYAVGLVLEKGFLAEVGFNGYKIATVERVINGEPEDINIAEEVLITDFENMHDFAERITNVTDEEVGI